MNLLSCFECIQLLHQKNVHQEKLTVIKWTVCLHAQAAIRWLPIAAVAEVLVGVAADEPLRLLKGNKRHIF